MLKVSLSAAEYTELDDVLKNEYALQTDGAYKVDLGPDVFTTDRDPVGLMSALTKERDENRKVREVADRLEAERKTAELDGAKNVEQVRELFRKELEERDAKAKEEREAREAELMQQRQTNATRLANEEALKIASDLYGSQASLMLPHVQARIKGKVMENGEPLMEVVDPTTQTPILDQNFENLRKTLSTDPMFKSMVVVSNASGGSANGDGMKNTLATTKDDGTLKSYRDYNSGELVRLKRDQPDVFESLRQAQTSSY